MVFFPGIFLWCFFLVFFPSVFLLLSLPFILVRPSASLKRVSVSVARHRQAPPKPVYWSRTLELSSQKLPLIL